VCHINKAFERKRHVIKENWREIFDAAFEKHDGTESEERARTEKAAILKELAEFSYFRADRRCRNRKKPLCYPCFVNHSRFVTVVAAPSRSYGKSASSHEPSDDKKWR
jgi:hypothetical protein